MWLEWNGTRATGLGQGWAPCRGYTGPSPFCCGNAGCFGHVRAAVRYWLRKYRRTSIPNTQHVDRGHTGGLCTPLTEFLGRMAKLSGVHTLSHAELLEKGWPPLLPPGLSQERQAPLPGHGIWAKAPTCQQELVAGARTPLGVRKWGVGDGDNRPSWCLACPALAGASFSPHCPQVQEQGGLRLIPAHSTQAFGDLARACLTPQCGYF